MKKTNKFLSILFAVLKGTLVGLAIVIPGVSGGSMLMTIGVYEDAVSITSHDKELRKKSIKKLIPYAIGIVVGVAALSFVITWLLEHFEFFTILLFVGLILGSLPMLIKKVKGCKIKPLYIIIALVMIIIMVGLPYLNNTSKESFVRLGGTDKVSVGERVIISEDDLGDSVVLSGENFTVYEIDSAPGSKDGTSGFMFENDNVDGEFFGGADSAYFITFDENGAALLTDNNGNVSAFTLYRAKDALNNGIFSALLSLLLGFIAAGTMIVPGISGSMVLLVLGYYNSVMTHLKSCIVCLFSLDFAGVGSHLLVLGPFIVGVALGLLVVSKLVKWLLDKHPVPTYYGIIGLMVSSPYAILVKATCFGSSFAASLANWWFIPIAVICLVGGFFAAWQMSRKEN